MLEDDILRAELERLYELGELLRLSRDVLGFDPDVVGGTLTKAAFASALTEYCEDHDAIEALCDALLATRAGVDRRIDGIRSSSLDCAPDLLDGVELGTFTKLRKLAEGRHGVSYVGERNGVEQRVKVLYPSASRDGRGVQRLATWTRLLAPIEADGLPRGLELQRLGRLVYITHAHAEGSALRTWLMRAGALTYDDCRDALRAIVVALSALHERRLVHGNLHLDNVIVSDSLERVVLVDAGFDRLTVAPRPRTPGAALVPSAFGKCSPEQMRGLSPDARSDVYAFGALLFELLTGQEPFTGDDPATAALGHLTLEPPAPSKLVPNARLSSELDELVLSLLRKDPSARPADARAVLTQLDRLTRPSVPVGAELDDAALDELLQRFKNDPTDEEAALALEAAATGSERARPAGEALLEAARSPGGAALVHRAARVFASRAETRERAEAAYVEHLEHSPDDPVARAALLELRRRLGKFEDVVEMLLADAERAPSATEKARLFADIARVYAHDLRDPDQALVAWTQAFAEDPRETPVAYEIERLASARQEAWHEVLETLSAAAEDASRDPTARATLLNRLGQWWAERAQRPDLAAAAHRAVLAFEPSNDTALEALAQIYRRAQQWSELAALLVQRARAATPAKGRDALTEAAEILEGQLNDTANARALYEQVVADDPVHPRAAPALARLYERTSDFNALVSLLERGVSARRGEARTELLCRIAEVFESDLNDVNEALRRFGAALEHDPASLDALRGIDRLYTRLGRYKELLENLERQVELAATPRQKASLLERVARLQSEEFLDAGAALDTLERLLAIDPSHSAALAAALRHALLLERWELAVALYERAIAAEKDRGEQGRLLLGLADLLAEKLGAEERAARVYERALELDPEEPRALNQVAKLTASAGDAERALAAIETLAVQAASPEARAEQWVRAAKLLEAHGDRDRAIERYKRALDENPRDSSAASGLRDAYAARGDAAAAVQLLERQLEWTEGNLAKAALLGRLCVLYREGLHDGPRAEEAAKRALTLDPTNVDALLTMGEVTYDEGRHLEACKHFEALSGRGESLDRAVYAHVLSRHAETLGLTGTPERAVEPMEALLRLQPDDAPVLRRVADVVFAHGDKGRAAELYGELAARFDEVLLPSERVQVLFRRGEALRSSGKLAEAREVLERAADLDPASPDPLVALAKLHESQNSWAEAVKTKMRHLDIATGDERVQLLLDVSELSGQKLGDRTQAAKSLVAALDERPDDRRLLTKLMQLYSEEKDWHKLVEVVLRLADFVDDPKQRVKYLHTAAIVTARQIGDTERALEFYDQVLELEPAFDKAIWESIELWRKRGDHGAVERLLKRRLELATEADDRAAMVEAFDALGDLYDKSLGATDRAVDALEAAHTLDPTNAERGERLRQLYASDPDHYLEKAVRSQLELLHAHPYNAESYRALRRLYTEAKRADEAWCLCQALTVLNLAEPDEERFYRRMRPDTAAPAETPLDDECWLNLVMHPDADPLLTSIFALIEPAVILRRTQSIAELGYDEGWLVTLAGHPAPVCQSLYYGAGVLGIPLPPTYENPNDPGGVSFLFAHEPSLVLGVTALRTDVPLRLAAFIAANKLAYLRPGMYVRHLLASGTALKAWLFAAIKLTSPAFPVAPEIEGAVNEARAALEASLHGQARDQLTRVVAKLLTSGAALDLKRWVLAVDLTADRAGLLVAHDLETALEVIRASDDGSSAPMEDRVKEALLYSVSPEYLALRKKLRITVDS